MYVFLLPFFIIFILINFFFFLPFLFLLWLGVKWEQYFFTILLYLYPVNIVKVKNEKKNLTDPKLFSTLFFSHKLNNLKICH